MREVDVRGVGGCAAAFFDVAVLGADLPVADLPVADLLGVALFGAGLRAPVLRPEPL